MDDFDIYGDLESALIKTPKKKTDEDVKKLTEQVCDLNKTIVKLEEKIKKLRTRNKVVEFNLSATLATARHEVNRKDARIDELTREKDSIVFRRNGGQLKQELPKVMKSIGTQCDDLIPVAGTTEPAQKVMDVVRNDTKKNRTISETDVVESLLALSRGPTNNINANHHHHHLNSHRQGQENKRDNAKRKLHSLFGDSPDVHEVKNSDQSTNQHKVHDRHHNTNYYSHEPEKKSDNRTRDRERDRYRGHNNQSKSSHRSRDRSHHENSGRGRHETGSRSRREDDDRKRKSSKSRDDRNAREKKYITEQPKTPDSLKLLNDRARILKELEETEENTVNQPKENIAEEPLRNNEIERDQTVIVNDEGGVNVNPAIEEVTLTNDQTNDACVNVKTVEEYNDQIPTLQVKANEMDNVVIEPPMEHLSSDYRLGNSTEVKKSSDYKNREKNIRSKLKVPKKRDRSPEKTETKSKRQKVDPKLIQNEEIKDVTPMDELNIDSKISARDDVEKSNSQTVENTQQVTENSTINEIEKETQDEDVLDKSLNSSVEIKTKYSVYTMSTVGDETHVTMKRIKRSKKKLEQK